MEFNPEMSDRELLELLSAAIRVPPVRRVILARLEQLVLLHGDEIEAQDSQIPFIPARPPIRPLNDVPFTEHTPTAELRVYPFNLVKQKKQETWMQEVPESADEDGANLYLLLPELIQYITSKIVEKKVKNISEERVILTTSRGFQSYNICAERVSKKEISGTLFDLNENMVIDGEQDTANQMFNNVIYINTENFKNLPEQEKLYGMIEFINIYPGLRKSLLDYFYIILKPIFMNARERIAK
jgi:hypothetical protein